MSEIETKPLDHDVWTASRQAIRDEQKAQPGSLLDLLLTACLIAVGCLFAAGYLVWPSPYSAAREAQMTIAIGYMAGGLITALLLGAVGRIIQLLEVIAGRKA
jgi:uncharacterized transporter YbjL